MKKFLFCFLFVCFETGLPCVTVLAVLELALVDQAQTHRDSPTSASQVLGLKAYATTAQLR